MIDILKGFIKKLTNLTSTNKSLLHLRLYANQDADLDDFDFLHGTSSFDLLGKILAKSGVNVPLIDVLDSRNANVNKLSAQLKQMKRRVDFVFEEKGSYDLYLGWPYVEGRFQDNTAFRCPLLFVPVVLKIEGEKWVLQRKKDVSITLNKSFLLAYAFYNRVKIEDELLETTFDDFSKDIVDFRKELYDFLKQSPLEINFNQDLFINKLHRFVDYKKEDFQVRYKTGEAKLQPYAVLGLFPQASSYLIPDYEKMIATNEYTSFEDFFSARQSQHNQSQSNYAFKYLKEIREDQTYAPYKLDAFQENALKAVKRGNSVVVHGPPGTGKSQLICNLVADHISRGCKVLVVCQKKAALDVVYRRLEDKELHDFALVVHDFKVDRKPIYDKINEQIEKITEFERRNNSLDTVFLERDFLHKSREIDRITEELDEFKEALFKEDESGFSPKELYLRTDKNGVLVSDKIDFKYFNKQVERDFLSELAIFYAYASRFEKENYVWKNRVDFSSFSLQDYQEIRQVVLSVQRTVNAFSTASAQLLSQAITYQEHLWIVDRAQQWLDLMSLLKSERVFEHYQFMLSADQCNRDWLLLREKRILDLYKGEGIERSLKKEELGEIHQKLENYLSVRSNVFRRLSWNFFSKDKSVLKETAIKNKLKWNKSGMQTLATKLDNRLNLEHNLTQLASKSWLKYVPDTLDVEELQQYFDEVSIALQAVDLTNELRNFVKHLFKKCNTVSAFQRCGNELLLLCKELNWQTAIWQKYLNQKQILQILEVEAFSEELLHSLDRDFDSLCDYDNLLRTWSKTKVETATVLFNQFPTANEAKVAFANSNGLAWLDFLESKHPVLRTVSSLQMHKQEQDLRLAIQNKSKICADIVLQKLRENTYKHVEYNRLKNRITYRDLQHQLTKKRKIWPLRKLVENFSDEIYDLIPCWLASPESVSAIFPLHKKFDLVIFDEASQCFAEKGIPAIYRAKQVVITGDAQQLAPSDLYQARWEEEEEQMELEVDSLLDLGINYFQQVELLGHYRSQSMDLIDFSNQHFYKNRLRLLPDYKRITDNTPAIKYLKVNGLWQNNTNEVEADCIVQQLKQLLAEGERSIGVITFNYKQQQLIQDKIEQCAREENLVLPSSVFVKNIENVQGDERDIILFSIGYAPNLKGKVVAHFGSLNLDKGENRLNVAVSRARKKIIVVASVHPVDFNVEEAKHRGPKLLKAYLEYALTVSEQANQIVDKKMLFSREWYLKHTLKTTLPENKITFSADMPFADITVKSQDTYKGLILTDDDGYYESISAKDWHAYLPMMLSEKNWQYFHLYSRAYWNDKKNVNKLLEKMIE